MEQWADLLGWPGYKVSSLGRLFGPRNHQLAGYFDKNGYHCVYVGPRKDGKGIKIHRAVVEAFINPIPATMQVNHKNGVKNDNRLENLEIVTPSQNAKHAFDVLGRKIIIGRRLHGEEHHHASLTEANVLEIRRLWREGHTQPAIAKLFNTSQPNISAILLKKAWKHVSD